jgi:hypothetical protein
MGVHRAGVAILGPTSPPLSFNKYLLILFPLDLIFSTFSSSPPLALPTSSPLLSGKKIPFSDELHHARHHILPPSVTTARKPRRTGFGSRRLKAATPPLMLGARKGEPTFLRLVVGDATSRQGAML